MVASLVTLRLVSLGSLQLDEEVNHYLPDWKLRSTEGRTQRVTLRQILSHTGGVNVHGAPGYPRGSEFPTLDQVLNGEAPAITAPVIVTAEPGRTYRYSAGGYCVLQRVIETVTGHTFEQATKQLVFDPLEMSNSTFAQPLPEHLWNQAASAHLTLAKAPCFERWFVYPEQAVGGLWTTATDLAKVVIEIQQATRGQGRLLTRELAGEMLTQHSDNYNVGLGTYISNATTPETAFFSHTGAHLGWQAIAMGYVSLGKGAVVLTNNGYTGSELYREFLLSVAEEYAWPGFTGSFR
jgi:CubicO group peptidase (beta-lactamase class C family)